MPSTNSSHKWGGWGAELVALTLNSFMKDYNNWANGGNPWLHREAVQMLALEKEVSIFQAELQQF